MNWIFDNDILPLSEVHNIMNNPIDLNRKQFNLLCYFTGHGAKDVIFCDKTYTAMIQSGLVNSKSDFIRKLKEGSLFVGKRKVINLDDELNPQEFFNTGFEDVRWSTVKHGKKKNKIIIIQKNNNIDEEWFDIGVEEWISNNYVKHFVQLNAIKN
jgi:hypothetical protein